MDSEQLKRDHGAEFCFEGGSRAQITLPFGTVNDVRREVEERIDVLSRRQRVPFGCAICRIGVPP